MKVSRRDLGIIMVLLGIAAAFVVYQFFFRTTMAQVETLKADCADLEAQIKVIDEVSKNEQEIVTQTANWEKSLNDLVAHYPVKYLYEDGIMYLRDYEEGKMDLKFDAYTVVETYVLRAESAVVNGVDKNYVYGLSTISSSFTAGTYADMKAFINSIYDDKHEKNVESITMAFNSSTGEVKGNLLINMYSLTDGVTNEYEGVQIPAVEMKPGCIFGPIVTPPPVVPDEEVAE